MMRRSHVPVSARALAALAGLLLVACGGGPAPAPRTTTPAPASSPAERGPASHDALIARMLERLRRVADCGGERPRVWCVAAEGWSDGAAADLPADAAHALAGITVGLAAELPDDELLASGGVSLSAFALRRDGDRVLALIADVPYENASEQRQVEAAVDAVALVARGEAPRAEVSAALYGYLRELRGQARYPLARAGAEWRYDGAAQARVRRVGDLWVAVEVPKEGPEGIFVSIYTDRVASRKAPPRR